MVNSQIMVQCIHSCWKILFLCKGDLLILFASLSDKNVDVSQLSARFANMSKFLRWLHRGYGGSHFDSRNFWLLSSIYAWGARVVQWWGHSPLTRVARVGILVLVLYVCWGYCWFCPLLCEVFLCVFQFSPLLKYQHFQIPIRSGMHGQVSLSS